VQRRPRFFVDDLAPASVPLPPGEAHHATAVLRLSPGDAVELFDGRGADADGRIVEARRSKVTVAVEQRRPPEPRHTPIVHLAFAIPKGKRLDWLLEKATELAAASLRPIAFERSVVGAGRLTQQRRRRWQAHCIAAAKQSGLNWLPEIRPPMPLGDFLTESLTDAAGYFGIVGVAGAGARCLADVLACRPPAGDLCLLVGPEGGLTRAEVTGAVQAGFVPARLGRTVLRVETAAVALLAAAVALGEGQQDQTPRR